MGLEEPNRAFEMAQVVEHPTVYLWSKVLIPLMAFFLKCPLYAILAFKNWANLSPSTFDTKIEVVRLILHM